MKDRIDVRIMKSDTFMFVYVFELLCDGFEIKWNKME